ncbi:putative small multi-drug export protein-domain-containing protein, partial [Pelagophyceae sp. CCMP2097]
IIAMIAAMPVVELRGAIPVGCIMGVPLPKVFLLSVLGNMIPVLPLILALRAPVVQRILAKPLSKARRLSSDVLGDGKARWTALAAFVGVPFPGTGAWTGAMIAFVLGIPLFEGVSAIFVGVVSAGLIVSALARAGAKGAVVAVGGIVAIYAAQQLTASKK